ncbi:MAG TPA: LrgB family protein [Longimicrobiaceae bacterium]|nr:LrgB family protein [Longimicrobiaceae bacterium]
MAEPAAALIAVAATLAVFSAARWLAERTGWTVLNPVLVAIVVLIAGLRLLHVDYAAYDTGGRWIGWLLGPAVVALGYPLAAQMDEIVRRARSILVSILAGSAAGIVSAAGVAALLGGSRPVVLSLVPRAVTTPIAIGIAQRIGGLPPLSAALVIGTGVVGAVLGPPLYRALGVTSRTAWGLGIGAAAHGVGTARAAQEGEAEGAAAGLAIGLMGIATALLAPLAVAVLDWLVFGP